MLAKPFRLSLKPWPITRQYNRYSSRLMLVFYQCNQTHLRLGMVVSKKVAPRAVTRNQIKRRLAHATRNVLGLKLPLDIVYIARPRLAQSSFSEIVEEIKIFKQNIDI